MKKRVYVKPSYKVIYVNTLNCLAGSDVNRFEPGKGASFGGSEDNYSGQRSRESSEVKQIWENCW